MVRFTCAPSAAWAARRIDPIDAVVYILAQLSGAVLGALAMEGAARCGSHSGFKVATTNITATATVTVNLQPDSTPGSFRFVSRLTRVAACRQSCRRSPDMAIRFLKFAVVYLMLGMGMGMGSQGSGTTGGGSANDLATSRNASVETPQVCETSSGV